jgi:hypothetical protein
VTEVLYPDTRDAAFREALEALTGVKVPKHIRYAPRDEAQYEELMELIGEPPKVPWATTTGVICAAESVVETAVENGNIK